MGNDNLEKEIVFSQENLNEIEINVETENFVYNVLQIGEVKEGDTANATITGKEPNQILNLVLPKGIEGPKGDTGPKGNDGYTPIKGTDYWTTSDKQEIVNDVLNEIDIPTSTEDLTNDSGFITSNYLTGYATKEEIPTKVSQLQNDSNYLTTIPSNYVTEDELNSVIGDINTILSTLTTPSTSHPFDWEVIEVGLTTATVKCKTCGEVQEIDLTDDEVNNITMNFDLTDEQKKEQLTNSLKARNLVVNHSNS